MDTFSKDINCPEQSWAVVFFFLLICLFLISSSITIHEKYRLCESFHSCSYKTHYFTWSLDSKAFISVLFLTKEQRKGHFWELWSKGVSGNWRGWHRRSVLVMISFVSVKCGLSPGHFFPPSGASAVDHSLLTVAPETKWGLPLPPPFSLCSLCHWGLTSLSLGCARSVYAPSPGSYAEPLEKKPVRRWSRLNEASSLALAQPLQAVTPRSW